jgi:DNA end-binding protein Ku
MEVLQRSVEQTRKSRERPSADQKRVKRLPADGKKNARKKKAVQGGKDQLEQLSKGELYEQATKLDIPGRSKMNRDQLINALTKAAS